ncbi:MAG: glycerophosphoryl diester phosphodiesterase membrane domain-containing protein [Acidobacteriia bacterium]|nr:glycerophosphoryl diester phosphodiesterase membrane domain-containing protein [Terriglobia bacterium]
MQNLDLRPLSLGEILDRTFTLYKNNFVLFAGISMIPQLLVLAFQMIQVFFMKMPQMPVPPHAPPVISQWQATGEGLTGLLSGLWLGLLLGIVGAIIYIAALLLSNGATVLAVSELYLGRTITVSESLRRVRGSVLSLFVLALLTGLACVAGFILLIVPGFYIACRLAVSVPATVIEDLNATDAMSRSFDLTKDFAGRAFLIYLLYVVLLYSAMGLLQMPFIFGLFIARNDPNMLRFWTALMQIGGFAAGVLVTPVITIATSLFYYDLRVRKEAFDLQIMMGGADKPFPGSSGGVPSMLS